jgi:hypothetical protein
MHSRDGQSGAGFTKVTPFLTVALGLLQIRPIWLSAQPTASMARPPSSEDSVQRAAKRRIILKVLRPNELQNFSYGTWQREQVKVRCCADGVGAGASLLQWELNESSIWRDE